MRITSHLALHDTPSGKTSRGVAAFELDRQDLAESLFAGSLID